MDIFAEAQSLYRTSRALLDGTRDLAVDNGEMRWLREDIEECLLDIKLAVMDGDEGLVGRLASELKQLLTDMNRLLNRE